MNKQKTMIWVKSSTVKWYVIVAVLAMLMTSCHNSQDKSNETTTPTYQDQAEEFKKGLGGENIIMAEVIDSTWQRIYYCDTIKKTIFSYDIAARRITPIWECENNEGVKYAKMAKSAKQYGKRLFFGSYLEDFYDQASASIWYIDLTNDSAHYILDDFVSTWDGGDEVFPEPFLDENIGVETPYESFLVSFLDEDIVLKRRYGRTSWSTHISPYLSDEEYQEARSNYIKKTTYYMEQERENEQSRNVQRQEQATPSNQSASNSVQQRLEQANQEYFQYIKEYQSTSDYMWQMQRLQAAYNANERCIGLARELDDQFALIGFLQRKAALEGMGVR